MHRAVEAVALGVALVGLLAISAARLPRQQQAAANAPWCRDGEVPAFHFGFASLQEATGSVMGTPTECEHGTDESNGTVQRTTTGVAIYNSCTNVPEFTRGQEHWLLTPERLEHWVGGTDPPIALPIVQAPDLRNPCPG